VVTAIAVPETLLERRVFGHAKGAFTDAKHSRQGLFQKARRHVFLDEIGEMALRCSTSSCGRQERKCAGRPRPRPRPDGRCPVLTATNREIEGNMVEDKRFRGDLYTDIKGSTSR